MKSELIAGAIIAALVGTGLGTVARLQLRQCSERDWLSTYSGRVDTFSDQTEQCIGEMLSLKYDPVQSGPVCRQACAAYNSLQSFVRAAPPYVDHPEQYLLDEPWSVCEEAK